MGRTKQRPAASAAKPKVLDPLPSNTRPIVREGTNAIAYHIPVARPSLDNSILKTTIALPRRSEWTSGLHFHAVHTEFLRLVQGSIFVKLDGETTVLSAKAGGQVSIRTGRLIKSGLEIEIPKYMRHNWGRADHYLTSRRTLPAGVRVHRPKDTDEEAVVEEWTDPSDITKLLFFWNLNGVITSPPVTLSGMQTVAKTILGGWWVPFQLFIIFWDLDNWPIFLNMEHTSEPFLPKGIGMRLERWVDHIATYIVLSIAKALGCILDMKAVKQERTPDELWKVYKTHVE